MLTTVQTDDDIAHVIKDCCQLGDNNELADQIEVFFVAPEETLDQLTDMRFKPTPKILINKSAWMTADDPERLYSLKSEVCYLLACTVFSRKVKRDGPEWRYFAFETGVIELETEPREIESFVLLSDW